MPKALFPRAMQLVSFQQTLSFEAGWQDIPDHLVGHWWLVQNGVTVVARPT